MMPQSNEVRQKPKLLALVGASGSGKTTVANALARHDGFGIVRTCTTRLPEQRIDENGISRMEGPADYLFVSEAEFSGMEQSGHLLATTVAHGNRYGVPKTEIEAVANAGVVGVMVLDEWGAMELKKSHGCVVARVDRDSRARGEALAERFALNKLDDAVETDRLANLPRCDPDFIIQSDEGATRLPDIPRRVEASMLALAERQRTSLPVAERNSTERRHGFGR